MITLASSVVAVHSHALPHILSAPYGLLPSGNEFTGMRRPGDLGLSLTLASLESGLSPQGNFGPEAPRAAFSHSNSVGRRLPAHFANFVASSNVTFTTGLPGDPSGTSQPVCLQNS